MSRYFCELHKEYCDIDSEGFGGCGDYNKDGSCLWSKTTLPEGHQ